MVNKKLIQEAEQAVLNNTILTGTGLFSQISTGNVVAYPDSNSIVDYMRSTYLGTGTPINSTYITYNGTATYVPFHRFGEIKTDISPAKEVSITEKVISSIFKNLFKNGSKVDIA